MRIFIVYVLYSEKSSKYYIGQTNNILEHLIRHNLGYEISTSPYKPWKLICTIEKPSGAEAINLERKLQNLNTEDLKKFINKYSKFNVHG